ncbi:MAG: Kynureninase [Bacteroidia bacterium]|nr:Kynureninase [Bacteroidia bacterium]
MNFINTLEFAQQQDKADSLSAFRNRFFFPELNGKEAIYFCGNSLGLQPKTAAAALEQELNDWAKFAVEGHFHAKNPWFSYEKMFDKPLAKLVGAKPSEVCTFGSLTNNLHLLMVSFYRPTATRFKILCEEKPFASDQYALESQVKFHGFNPNEAIVELKPRAGEYTLRTEDILAKIEELNDELALVMIGGVNYYTGQAFDMKSITEVAHKVGALAGFDLAHAMGNLVMNLHDWNVDFACWCSYKYLNSGPGSVAGIFVHESHGNNANLPRFAGWWGNNPNTRFKMEKGFVPAVGADGWQLSNAPIFSMAVHKAALNIFDEAGIENLRGKSEKLTAYLEFIVEQINSPRSNVQSPKITILTPRDKDQRGCQLSLVFSEDGKQVHEQLLKAGIITDWRNPDVIRLAPVPLYNSFEDVWRFGNELQRILNA